MSALNELIFKRGQIKAQLTRFRKFIDTCTERELSQLPNRLSRAEQLMTNFEAIQSDLEALALSQITNEKGEHDLAAVQQLEEQFEETRGQFEDQYFEIIERGKSMIIVSTPNSVGTEAPSSTATAGLETSTNVKLPTLTLPTFNGNYDQWLLFKDSFKSLIHVNTRLSGVQKFQYLRSSLKDTALQVVQSLETSEENYEIAWSLLTKRYENKRLIINTHMKELFDIAAVPSGSLSAMHQFIDKIQTHMRALESLGQPVEKWDTVLIHILSSRLGFNVRKDWEIHIGKMSEHNMPTMKQWIEFLTNHCHTLELIDGAMAKQNNKQNTKPVSFKKPSGKITLATTTSQCGYCQGSHFINRCEDFIKLTVPERQSEANRKRLCINCLKKGHFVQNCSSSTCRKCSRKHNSLLHLDQGTYTRRNQQEEITQQYDAPNTSSSKEELEPKPKVSAYCSRQRNQIKDEEESIITQNHQSHSQVILSTAQVHIFDIKGNPIKGRALLDPGSQSSLITKSFLNKLKIPSKQVNIPISGIRQSKANIRESVSVKLKSLQNNYQATIECLVLDSITESLPQVKINSQDLSIPQYIRLADPKYGTPGDINLLIGAGLFWQLLCVGRADLGKNKPILQKTLLGWVLGGEMRNDPPRSLAIHCLAVNQRADEIMEKHWKLEEITYQNYTTKKEEQCEQHYKETARRTPEGRFLLRLPIDPAVQLGESKQGALRRLKKTEEKLQAQPELRSQYIKFLKEYEELGHMTPVEEKTNTSTGDIYYLPHQPVIRTTSVTTKVRVVFDGSAKTSINTSLNDKLLTGPNLQEDLLDIVLRFRSHRYVLTADVEMMFRQILIAEEDRDLQRILWRSDSSQPIQEYTLNTVTYGTSCAPYLAMRCLKQLVEEEGSGLPLAARALLQDCYMDDVLTGCDTFHEAKELQGQLSELLARAKFPLRKWRSNESKVLEHLEEESRANELMVLKMEDTLKTLGLLWNAAQDTLQYSVEIDQGGKPTKRNILSQIARIYDPLGLIGPIMINAKMIMQELWKFKLSWDESVPQSLYSIWCSYYSSLPKLNQLRIPRNTNPRNINPTMDLHGFSDASEKGYGACIYCTYQDINRRFSSYLMCSKSKVAPLKSVSLPGLELCAALLLARLMKIVWKALGNKVDRSYLWSDSTIVLCWINTQPHLLKTFVANRVAEIQELVPEVSWRHVPSRENPADLLSRGITVDALLNNQLWWSGPHWLTTKEWPKQPTYKLEEVIEQRIQVLVITYSPPSVLYKFSKYTKLQHVIAYCYRFINNAKGKRKYGPLSVEELQIADVSIISMIQRERFQSEIKQLQAGQQIKHNSALLMLKPFLGADNIIRVGGRLTNADIPETQRHPIVLPSRHFVTELIMQHEHQRLMHCGPEHLLNSIRQLYWPLSGRREARKVTRNCLQCFRYHPTPVNTVMADMPEARLKEFSRPFDRCGVDYAGPFLIRENKRRGRVPMAKAYVAVFICFSIKAIHLELVSSLTTESFLAALRRFAARRGTPSHIYSDNATNFVGANRQLNEVFDFLVKSEAEITKHLARQRIAWHFIPPRSPHFGGLWEAAVKSVKRHLTITLQGLTYTYEEYNTLLIEIEAILNSRPLTSISSDPHDMTALTPSHFLIGDSLLAPAQKYYYDVADNHLTRWEHIQKLHQHFWKRWRREYLNTLQARTNWHKEGINLKIRSLVLLVDDNSPPLHWPMGRVLEVHPGDDGVVRVATVRTATGTFKRAVRKLCAIPNED